MLEGRLSETKRKNEAQNIGGYSEENKKVEYQSMGESGGRELEEKEAPQIINENEQMENWMSDE